MKILAILFVVVGSAYAHANTTYSTNFNNVWQFSQINSGNPAVIQFNSTDADSHQSPTGSTFSPKKDSKKNKQPKQKENKTNGKS